MSLSLILPESLAAYHTQYLEVARMVHGNEIGPSMRSTSYTLLQTKFLADIAQAFHHLLDKDGVAFFYAQAEKINALWLPSAPLLLENDFSRQMNSLWPLPTDATYRSTPAPSVTVEL